MNGNLYARFQDAFQNKKDAVFIERPDGTTLTFGDLDRRAAQYANALAALGLEKGDRVMVQVNKSVENILLYLGALRAGGVYVPLNTAYTAEEVSYFMENAEPRVFVCDPSKKDAYKPIASRFGIAHLMTLDGTGDGTIAGAADEAQQDFETVDVDPDEDLAAFLYTSGTTGRSKGAMLSHGNLQSNAEALFEIWGWREDDVLIHALPVYHVHGLFVALHLPLLGASKVIFLDKFDADTVIDYLPRATVLMGVPTFYSRLVQNDRLSKETCESMRVFISGSAPLLEATFREFKEITGHKILERYGMTEAGMITSNPLDGERIEGTVGYPLPGVTARIAGEDGNILGTGEVGVLEITGPNVFKGYWRMPEKTDEEFRPDGFFITGDLAKMDDDGRISIVGRAKDLIISGGLNVYPKEVELCIDKLEGIEESAVIGVPHPDLGEAVVAVIKGKDAEGREESIIDRLKGELAGFKVPKRVVYVDSLPRNTMGKVQKKALRDQFSDLF